MTLEQRLKEETDFRIKVEQQLRYQRSQATSQLAWTHEEVKDLKAQLADKETELAKLRDGCQRRTMDHEKELRECRVMLRAANNKCNELESALAGETRVKIELFRSLSDARHKHDEELRQCHAMLRTANNKCDELESALAGETRVKIELSDH